MSFESLALTRYLPAVPPSVVLQGRSCVWPRFDKPTLIWVTAFDGVQNLTLAEHAKWWPASRASGLLEVAEAAARSSTTQRPLRIDADSEELLLRNRAGKYFAHVSVDNILKGSKRLQRTV
jgi:hypothetical protein